MLSEQSYIKETVWFLRLGHVTSADSQNVSESRDDPSKPGAQQRVKSISAQRENSLIDR
jgi:hypothetical protein